MTNAATGNNMMDCTIERSLELTPEDQEKIGDAKYKHIEDALINYCSKMDVKINVLRQDTSVDITIMMLRKFVFTLL